MHHGLEVCYSRSSVLENTRSDQRLSGEILLVYHKRYKASSTDE
jgi:hypothetical protein